MRWPAFVLFSVVLAGSIAGVAYKRYTDRLADLRHATRVASTG